ncbi:MAG TPA: hypothetical protein PK095_17295, partial [Myxococcota bacterium]|nr:hypothetical protein [Myxococcota bacterium]
MLELVTVFVFGLPGAPPEGAGEPIVPVVPVLVIEDGATFDPDEVAPEAPLSARLFGRFDERLLTDLSWLESEPVFEARKMYE